MLNGNRDSGVFPTRYEVPHCIKRLLKKGCTAKSSGSAIYIWALFLIMFIASLFSVMYMLYMAYMVRDSIDDALITSLLAASAVNTEEYGRTHQLVIFKNSTTPEDPLNDPENLSCADTYLTNAYDVFRKSFIENLNLNSDMTTSMPFVRGKVHIDNFKIFNMYRTFDAGGNPVDSRVYEYTFTGGNWFVTAKNINDSVYLFNSLDDSNTLIENTTVSAKLSFDLQFFPNLSVYIKDADLADRIHRVFNYQRMVDVTFY